jgi:polyisoprenyl-teichoic acid--peptidoglycan teichoic acid transferase
MPPRRDLRSPSAPPPAWEPPSGAGPHRRPAKGSPPGSASPRRSLLSGILSPLRLFSPPPLRTLALAGLAGLGALTTLTVLSAIWPRYDRSEEPRSEITAASLADKPRRAVTVLVIGSDADRLDAPANGAAPPGPANSDALLLLRVNPKGPLQVLNLPLELAVMLPGESRPQRLGDLYRRGGIALTADAVRELVGLEPPAPERYLVLPRSALRKLVDQLGGLELDPPRTMRYEDKAQKYRIDLQSGLQRLDGSQVEQMLRFRDKWLGEAGRRTNHQLVETALRQQLGRPEQLGRLGDLLRGMEAKVETNLSEAESLSLLAAGLDDQRPVQFSSLPLAPEKKEHGGLRQLDREASRPLWKAP